MARPVVQVGLGPTAHMSRFLAVFFAAGATVAHLSLLVAHPAEVDETAVRLTATAAYPAAALLYFVGPRLPRWTIHVMLAVGTLLITVGMYFSGGGVPSATTPIFYIWVALFAFTFFGSMEGAAHLFGIAIAYGAELVVTGERESIAQWVTVLGTVTVTGYVVGRLVDHNTHLAVTDSLTGLTNRRAFDALLRQELDAGQRNGNAVAVAVLDLDGFKHVNDMFGHSIGDDLLRICATRLSNCVRGTDTVARLGGDEFAIVFTGPSPSAADLGTRRVVDALRRSVSLQGHELEVGASVGLAYATPGISPAELLRNADLAMYVAKASRHGGYEVYEESMYERAVERLQLETDLREAVAGGGISAAYQPIVAIATGEIEGVEVLARWHHPARGYVPPETFIAIAERTGLIDELGYQVFERACATARRLHEARPDIEITVNVSPVQLADDGLASKFAGALARQGVDPCRFVVEITESALVQDVDLTSRRLHELKQLGVRIAVDDFGVGHSSLSHLRNFPIDVLKIDKSFVDGLPDGGGQLTRAVIQMGVLLGLDVVAEGIEQQAQLDELRVLGCAQGQGYLFASPMSDDDLMRHIAARNAAPPARGHTSPLVSDVS